MTINSVFVTFSRFSKAISLTRRVAKSANPRLAFQGTALQSTKTLMLQLVGKAPKKFPLWCLLIQFHCAISLCHVCIVPFHFNFNVSCQSCPWLGPECLLSFMHQRWISKFSIQSTKMTIRVLKRWQPSLQSFLLQEVLRSSTQNILAQSHCMQITLYPTVYKSSCTFCNKNCKQTYCILQKVSYKCKTLAACKRNHRCRNLWFTLSWGLHFS